MSYKFSTSLSTESIVSVLPFWKKNRVCLQITASSAKHILFRQILCTSDMCKSTFKPIQLYVDIDLNICMLYTYNIIFVKNIFFIRDNEIETTICNDCDWCVIQ